MINDEKIKKGLELIGREITAGSGYSFVVSGDELKIVDPSQSELVLKGVVRSDDPVVMEMDLVSIDGSGEEEVAFLADVFLEDDHVEFEENPRPKIVRYFSK